MTDTNKKTYRQPERLASLGKYGDGATFTIRFVDEPQKRGEHSLSALDLARSYDALPGIEQDRLGEFVRSAWKRQEGTEKAREDASARFERLDWMQHVLELRREGWTLEDVFRHTGSSKAEEARLIAVTDALESWLEGEKQRRGQEERPEKDDKKEAQSPAMEAARGAAAADVFGLGAIHAGTPGLAYLTEFFAEGDHDFGDAHWIADHIDSGSILACPRCHFLHLPSRPFPLDTVLVKHIEEGLTAPPLDACDVCAFLPESCRLPLVPQEMGKALALASEDLAQQRAKRAKLLYDLFMGQADGADALVWARMGEALNEVRDLPQMPVK